MTKQEIIDAIVVLVRLLECSLQPDLRRSIDKKLLELIDKL